MMTRFTFTKLEDIDAVKGNDSLQAAIGYCGNDQVDFARGDEAVKIERTSKWAWPRIGGGWIIRFNDRHGDLWNVRMPSWWSPERQYAWRVFNGPGSATYGPWTEQALAERFETKDDLFCEINAHDGDYERITADLETGEEVPA